jgi:WD40 repeat protein
MSNRADIMGRPDPRSIAVPADFAVALTILRNRAGLSIRELAKRLDRESADSVPYSTLGGWFSGSHLPTPKLVALLPTLLRLCGEDNPREAGEWLAALERVRRVPGPRPNDSAIPFRGLASYEPEHAEYFFGRDALTAELVDLLTEHGRLGRPVIVVGPSGSGKSSLLRAGLIPQFTESGRYRLLTPGSTPLTAFAQQMADLVGRSTEQVAADLAADPEQAGAAISRAISHDDLLIVVDQFEEIFTSCADDADRMAFVVALCAMAGSGTRDGGPIVRVAIGLRADFYPQAVQFPLLRDCLQRAQLVVGPMTEHELREAITGPARRAKLTLEPGLVEVVLRDVAPSGARRVAGAGHDVGALPLLSHALLATCNQSRGRSLTLEHYRAAGGIYGAVSQSAENAYGQLTTVERRAAAHRLFLRLVHTDDDLTNTRRRVRYAEILNGQDATAVGDIQAVLAQFIEARLISADEDTVEITHEALLHAWHRLCGWLQADAAGLRIHRQLTTAATTWDETGRDPDTLYRGGRLEIVREWADEQSHRGQLNSAEREFLTTSVNRYVDEQRRARHRIRRRYQLLAIVTALVLVAAGVAAYARQLQITNGHDRTNADSDAKQSESRQLADEADRLRNADVPLAMQLALAAYRIAPTEEARSSLLNSTGVSSATRLLAPDGPISGMTLTRDGRVVAAGTDSGRLRIWTIDSAGRFILTGVLSTGRGGPINFLAFSGDGHRLVTAGQDSTVRVWDTTDPTHPRAAGVLTIPSGPALSIGISSDGAVVAAGTADAKVYLWHVPVGGAPSAVLAGATEAVGALAFAPEGHVLATGSDDAGVRLWRVDDPTHPVELGTVTVPGSRIFSVAISPDGRSLAAGAAAEHDVHLWDISNPMHPVSTGPPLTGPASWVNSVAFSPDGTELAAASSDSVLWLFELSSRQVIARLPHPSPVVGAAFRSASSVVSLSDDGTVREWNVPGPVIVGATDSVFAVSFDAEGQKLGIGPGSDDNTLTVWNPSDTQHPVRLGPALMGLPGHAAFSGSGALTPNGHTFVVGDDDGTVQLWNITDPAHPSRIGLPVQAAAPKTLVESVTVSPDGQLLAVNADDGAAHLFDISNPSKPIFLAALAAPSSGNIYQAAFNPTDSLLAAAAANREVYLWNISNRKHPVLLAKVGGFTSSAYSVAFSRNGTVLAAGSSDDTVRLWDVTHPNRPASLGKPLTGPVGYVYSIAFDPTNDVLATGSTDDTVWLWDLRRPSQPAHLATLTGPTQGVLGVAFAPNGQTLAAGGHDRTVRLWNTDPASVATWICATAGTPITPAEWQRYVPDQPYNPPCR